ncbi:hypothetical protein LCGC14_0844430 [marine sediment metagenome]|uniref:Uncharacterized protein n=1 Tax=marine sediment metagenome TaxID=412755 RepID=A0A0F9PGY8_9ZZZZ
MTTTQWAIEHADKIVLFLTGQGIKLTGTVIRDSLAEHIDDEIPGYCDNCEFKDSSDKDREPSAGEEARMMGEDRG